MDFILLWWFLAGLVGVLAVARRRRPVAWLGLGLVLTPIPALLLLLAIPHGSEALQRPWARLTVVILAAFVALASVLFYGRLAQAFFLPPSA